ncbi:MAG: response regulator, partial [Elusimicrobia bacterium]|nr:response regulator [Elusimicrobiota bacterium]MBD3412039.1 response regulator [Elusimicrobiota bacterium]
MQEKLVILIADSETKTAGELKAALEFQGYIVFVATTALIARGIIMKHSPHLIALNLNLPDIKDFDFLKELKASIMFQNIPVIIVSERNELEERVKGLKIGADDYIVKPFDLAELLARIGTIIRRNYFSLDANPLSRLPGNLSIMRTLEERLSSDKLVAITYFDLDNFKAYNDMYGFSQGDSIIKHTAKIILSAVHDFGNQDDFVGHIGGDDFIVISTPDRIDSICLNALRTFDETIPLYYSPEDRQRRKIVVEDRRGKLKEFPIMSISAATVTNQYKRIQHIGQISSITSELKKYAKSFRGSCYVKDRRDQAGGGSALVFGDASEDGEMKLTQEEEVKMVD